jgi:hypothetical protein
MLHPEPDVTKFIIFHPVINSTFSYFPRFVESSSQFPFLLQVFPQLLPPDSAIVPLSSLFLFLFLSLSLLPQHQRSLPLDSVSMKAKEKRQTFEKIQILLLPEQAERRRRRRKQTLADIYHPT